MKSTSNEVIKRPAYFLENLVNKSNKTVEQVKALYSQIEVAVEGFKSYGTVVLFRDESLYIKACRHDNVIPRPYYIIRGIEIIASAYHNNCFRNEIYCCVEVWVNLIFEYDQEENGSYFRGEEQPIWQTSLRDMKFEEKIYKENKYGIIERPHDGSWDTRIQIEDFSEFKKLKKIFQKGCKQIGYPDFGFALEN